MNPLDPRRAVAEAERQLMLARAQHHAQTRWLRNVLQRHRTALVVGAGFASGVLLGWSPLRRWLRTGASLLGAGITLARSPLGPIALGAMLGRRMQSSDDEHAPAD